MANPKPRNINDKNLKTLDEDKEKYIKEMKEEYRKAQRKPKKTGK